ncbi:MAG: N-acetylmuramoyl-L-alanine amidase [Bacillota bacterium]
MGKSTALILTLLFLIAPFFFPVIPADAATIPPQVEVQCAGTLNLRSGPSTAYPILARLPSATPLHVLFHETGWLLVRLNDGCTGWVAVNYTNFSASLLDKLPPIRAENVIVKADILNVRSGPGTGYHRLDQVRQGGTLTVYHRQDEWLLVRLADGSTGWVSGNYTEGQKGNRGPDEVKKEIPQAHTEPQEKTAAEPIVTMENPAETNRGLPGEQPPGESGTSLPTRIVVTASSLRLREGPGLQYDIVTSIPLNTMLNLQEEREEWLKVSLSDGREGWVARVYTMPLTVEEEDVAAANRPRLATVIASVLRVRSGPGLGFSQVDRVFSGNHLLVLNEEKGWNYVQLPNNNYGWVSSDYTSYNSPATAGGERNITIVIDPGHGGRDRGATGISGLLEKEVNLAVALQVGEMLGARGFNVMMTRSSDVEIGLENRINMAERAKTDLFVSIHANAHPNRNISGTEAFYAPGKAASPQSFYLATLLQQEISRALQLPSLGTKTARFQVIRETTMPSALIELAFLSNARDEALLRAPQAQKKAAEAIVRAILSYYNAV